MPGVTKEQIERARAVPILDYILSHEPNNYKRVGNEYRLKDHSVTMSNGKWHWQSHGFGGATATALNYLIKVRDFSFVDAVRHLAGDDIRSYDIPHKSKPPPRTHGRAGREASDQPERMTFSPPPRYRDNSRVIEYLQSRGIEKPLILDCIKRGSLYESANYHNCVFVGRDDNGKARFAALRGTRGDFKRDADGSDKCFGFILPPKDQNCDGRAAKIPINYDLPPSDNVKALADWLKAYNQKYDIRYVVMYHAAKANAPVLERGLLAGNNRRKNFGMSESGYVYLAPTPQMAQVFGDMAHNGNYAIYEVIVPVGKLLPDKGRLQFTSPDGVTGRSLR